MGTAVSSQVRHIHWQNCIYREYVQHLIFLIMAGASSRQFLCVQFSSRLLPYIPWTHKTLYFSSVFTTSQASWLLCPRTLNSINWAWWEIYKMQERIDYFRADHLPDPVYHIAMWMLVLGLKGQCTYGNEWQGTGKVIVRLMLAHSACGYVLTQGVVSQYSFRQVSYSPPWVAGDPFPLCLFLECAPATSSSLCWHLLDCLVN